MATLTELQTDLAELKAARTAALRAQSYRDPTGAMVTRPDIAILTKLISEIENRISVIQGDGFSHANAIFRGSR